MKNVVIIDNHDSFTGNLFQLFDETPGCKVTVIPVRDLKIEELRYFDKIVISPGPGVPAIYPKLFQMLDVYKRSKSILGVCLGHQVIAEYFGGKLFNLPNPLHGQEIAISLNQEEPLFKDLPSGIFVGLYHSWAVDPKSLPEELKVTATTPKGLIMGLRSLHFDCRGIQFHPESYMTKSGAKIIGNWLTDGV